MKRNQCHQDPIENPTKNNMVEAFNRYTNRNRTIVLGYCWGENLDTRATATSGSKSKNTFQQWLGAQSGKMEWQHK